MSIGTIGVALASVAGLLLAFRSKEPATPQGPPQSTPGSSGGSSAIAQPGPGAFVPPGVMSPGEAIATPDGGSVVVAPPVTAPPPARVEPGGDPEAVPTPLISLRIETRDLAIVNQSGGERQGYDLSMELIQNGKIVDSVVRNNPAGAQAHDTQACPQLLLETKPVVQPGIPFRIRIHVQANHHGEASWYGEANGSDRLPIVSQSPGSGWQITGCGTAGFLEITAS